MPQGFQQPLDAAAMLGGTEQHRRDEAFRQFAREIAEHPVARRFHVGEQLLHQFVVVIGELFQHREALGLLDRRHVRGHVDDFAFQVLLVNEGAFEGQVDEAGHDRAVHDRQLAHDQRFRTCRLQPVEHVARA